MTPTAVMGAGAWGTALAWLLAKKGEPVQLWAYEPEVAAQVKGFRQALALELDVSDEADVERAFEETVRAYGGVDIIVSNAGISSFGTLDVLPLAAPFVVPS